MSREGLVKNTMRKTRVVRGVAIFAISTGLSLWNMESQEVVALAPVSVESSLESRVQLWQESLPAADAASVTCKIKKLDHVRKIRVRQYQQELKRIREENARRKRMLEIRKCCGVNITESDRIILEKIVQAEAGNQDHQGKLLVANVILNRVKNEKFPSTIREVVFAPRQFSPIADGSYAKACASQDTKKAVNEALRGVDGSQGALYFMDRRYADGGNVSWFDRSLTRLFQHQGHEFYK